MSKKDASLAPVPPSAMTILLSPVAGVVMFVFLLAGLLSCLWAMFVSGKVDLLPKEHGWAAISEGEITHHIAKELSHVTLARKAADLERAASWLLIGDTGARVRQGCPGWLFLADENRIHPRAEANAQARAQKVLAVRDWLAARNIRLLVALVPDKSRIAADQLCGISRSAQLADRAQRWQAQLQQAGVAVLDLAPTLQALGSSAYLRSDTHWSEAGAQAAALALAPQIGALGVTDVALFKDAYDPLIRNAHVVASPDARGAQPGETAADVAQLTPRLWKQRFGKAPLRSDISSRAA